MKGSGDVPMEVGRSAPHIRDTEDLRTCGALIGRREAHNLHSAVAKTPRSAHSIGAFKAFGRRRVAPHTDPRRRFGRSGERREAFRSARMSRSAATAAATASIARARGAQSTRREIRRHSTRVVPSSRARARSRDCLLYTSPSPRDKRQSRMPSSA